MNKQPIKALAKARQGFTLVELIVVITILAILGTIAFISLQGYSRSANNSRRISDIGLIRKSLEVENVKTGRYPTPDNYFTVTNTTNEIWKQGEFGEGATRQTKSLPKVLTDPIYEVKYTYSVDANNKTYQLAGVISSDSDIVLNHTNKTYAANEDTLTIIVGSYNGYAIKDTAGNVIAVPSLITTSTGNLDINSLSGETNKFILNKSSNVPSTFKNSIKQNTSNEFNYEIKILTNEEKSNVDSFVKAIGSAYSGSVFNTNPDYQKLNEVVTAATSANPTDKQTAEMLVMGKLIMEKVTNQKVSLDICLIGNKVLQTGQSTKIYDKGEYDYGYTPIINQDFINVTCVQGEIKKDGNLLTREEKTKFKYTSYTNTPGAKCPAGDFEGYAYSEILNEQTKNVSKDENITNGIQHKTATLTCNNGEITKSNEQAGTINCNEGFYINETTCENQWSGNQTTGYLFKNTSGVEQYPKSCNDLLNESVWKIISNSSPWNGIKFNDGVYYIKIDSNPAFKVYCDMTTDGGGWTKIVGNSLYSSGNFPFNPELYGINFKYDNGSFLAYQGSIINGNCSGPDGFYSVVIPIDFSSIKYKFTCDWYNAQPGYGYDINNDGTSELFINLFNKYGPTNSATIEEKRDITLNNNSKVFFSCSSCQALNLPNYLKIDYFMFR